MSETARTWHYAIAGAFVAALTLALTVLGRLLPVEALAVAVALVAAGCTVVWVLFVWFLVDTEDPEQMQP